ncbi:MAG: hypothetical protein D6678_00605 [Zetaproteobacteria bacterium]|nr:MAG: hypothetical protein D6678_00605 [Zetaproteobacteria bacterium]
MDAHMPWWWWLGRMVVLAALVLSVPWAARRVRGDEYARRTVVWLTLLGGMLGAHVHLWHSWGYRGELNSFEVGLPLWGSVVLLLGADMPFRHALRQVLRHPLMLCWIAYVAVMCASIALAMAPLYTAYEICRLIEQSLWLWVMAAILIRDECTGLLLWTLFGQTVALFVLAMVELFGLGAHRAWGWFAHPNHLAAFAELVGMLLLAQAMYRGPMRWRLFAALGGLLCFALLLASASRAGLASWVIGLGVVLLLSYRHGQWSMRSTLKWLLPSVLLLMLLEVLLLPGVLERMTHASVYTWLTRWTQIKGGMQIIADHPWGVGLNNYVHMLNSVDAYGRMLNPVDRGVMHNIYLLHWVEAGPLGLLTFLLLWGIAMRMAWRWRGAGGRAWVVGCCAALAAVGVHGMLDWVLRYAPLAYTWSLVLALLIAYTMRSGRIQRDSTAARMP